MNEKTFFGNLKWNLWANNPIIYQVLGICSTLAVTSSLLNTLVMTLAVTFCTSFSNFFVSVLRNYIPRSIRMITQTVIIAFFTIIVDIVSHAYVPAIHQALGVYIGLIITNCILMGRTEAFALTSRPMISFWDGITSGLGYMYVLMIVAFFREMLGFGTFFGIPVLSLIPGFTPWVFLISPASSFFLVGLLLWVTRAIMIAQENKKAAVVVSNVPNIAVQGGQA